jgi:hypothetical protein
MRVDNVTIYKLPTLSSCCKECCTVDDKVAEEIIDDQQHQQHQQQQQQGVTSAAVVPTDDNNNHHLLSATSSLVFPFANTPSFIELNLVPLPLLTDDGQQTPIGGRGWYSSAILSAMLLCGHDQLHRDLLSSKSTKQMMIELGSGSLGLSGITLAWVMSQITKQSSSSSSSSNKPTRYKIVCTDYDSDVLEKLQSNIEDTNQRMKEYFEKTYSTNNGSNNNFGNVELTSAHLDWTQYEQEQPLLKEAVDDDDDDDDDDSDDGDSDDSKYTITFVFGAALVYTEETECCVDQISKILRQSPNAVVWIVQWPRNGWFPLLQIQCKQTYHLKVEKYNVTDIHPQIHELANTFIPSAQNELDLNHVKAIRITRRSRNG